MNRRERRAGLSAARRREAIEGWGPWERRRAEMVNAPSFVTEAYTNNVYSVQFAPQMTPLGPMLCLMIQRHDQKLIRAWSDLQRIKNELVGPDRWAAELYPPASNLVDVANMYHLWVFPSGYSPPFGFQAWSPTAQLEVRA